MSGSVEVKAQEWSATPVRHLELHAAVSGGQRIIKLSGELDIASAPDLAYAVMNACASAHSLTLDLRELTFIDCTGLGTIISASRRCQEHAHEFRLIAGPPAVQRVFELTGLLEELPFDA